MNSKDKTMKDTNPLEGRTRETSVSRDADHLERVPLHKQQATDAYCFQDPSFRYRFVNDVPGRIDRFVRAGWTIVEENIAATYSAKNNAQKAQSAAGVWRTTNYGKDAKSTESVLMRIPLEIWEKDQAAKAVERQVTIDDVDPTGQIKRNLDMAIRPNYKLPIDRK